MGYRNYSVSNGFVVDPAGNGDFKTIATALTAASSRGGSGRIILMPGTYTENPALVTSWNLESFVSDGITPTVTINGNCTYSSAGTVSLSGIRLQTNSNNFLTVSGSVASIVNLNDCYLNSSNNTGISFTSSSSSAKINVNNCRGDLGTTGIGMHLSSSSGVIAYANCIFTNSGASQTGDSTTAGSVGYKWCEITYPVATSSTASFSQTQTKIDTSAQNVTSLTIGGSGSSAASLSQFTSGSAAAISISQTLNLMNSSINSNNSTHVITGAGTINYNGLTFVTTNCTIDVTTQNANCGTLRGSTTTAPSAGMLGERITSTASSVSLTNLTGANITSISLTAGVWDITGVAAFTSSAVVGTLFQLGISTASATMQGTIGDQNTYYNGASQNILSLTVPAFRAVVTTTTTYYLVGLMAFGSGTGSANGRISAVRVG